MIFINDSRGHERIFQSRERGRGGWGDGGGWGGMGGWGDGGGWGGWGDREGGGNLLALFFFSSAGSFLKQVNRSQMRQVLAQKSSNIDNRMSTGVDD